MVDFEGRNEGALMNREFFRHKEVCNRIGDAEAVRQTIIAGKLTAYVELNDCSCTKRSHSDDFPADGENTFADWYEIRFTDEPRRKVNEGPLSGWFETEYMLTGWFRVEASYAAKMARDPDGAFRVSIIADRTDGGTATFSPSDHVNLSNLWFHADDIERLATPTPAINERDNKPLDTRERATLLCIIGALVANARLDLSHPMKAGGAIAAMMPDLKLSARTIGEHLKAVREAMDSRKG